MKNKILVVVFIILIMLIILCLYLYNDTSLVYKVEDNRDYYISSFWINENNVLLFQLENSNKIAANKLNIQTNEVENIDIVEGMLKQIATDIIQVSNDKKIILIDTETVPQLLVMGEDNLYKLSLDIFKDSFFIKMSANGKYLTGANLSDGEIVINTFNTEKLTEKVINKIDNDKLPGVMLSRLNNGDIIYQAKNNKIYIAKVKDHSLYGYKEINVETGDKNIVNIFQSPDNSKIALLFLSNYWKLAVIDIDASKVNYYSLIESNRKYIIDKPYVTWSSNNQDIIISYNAYKGNIINKVISKIIIIDTISGNKREVLKYRGHKIGTVSLSSDNEFIIYILDGKEIRICNISGQLR